MVFLFSDRIRRIREKFDLLDEYDGLEWESEDDEE